MEFKTKTIVVTGGATGIGFQIAQDLYRKGAKVHILGRRTEKLKEACRSIKTEKSEGDICYHTCDIAKEEQVGREFAKIKAETGSVYALVNNAGINPSRNDILHTKIEDWNATIAVNLTGAFYCGKLAIEQMLEIGEGIIINIASIAATEALSTRTSYNASKFGLIGLTKSLAKDYAKNNIRVNAISPGYIKTELTTPFIEAMTQEQYQKLIRSHPLGRIGEVKDISNAVLFLLSENASWITGVNLPVDGGYLLGR